MILLPASTFCGYRSEPEIAAENRRRDEMVELAIRQVERVIENHQQQSVSQAYLALSPTAKERFHLHLLDFSKPAPFNAPEMARADIAASHMNILTGG